MAVHKLAQAGEFLRGHVYNKSNSTLYPHRLQLDVTAKDETYKPRGLGRKVKIRS